VRQDLLPADAVLPSLDAGSPELYRYLNRPHPETTFARLVDGLIAFRQLYTGKLWVEVMLVRGLNDTEAALRDIAAILRRIGPDEVHLNLPTRPPAETWVRPPDEEGLLRAQAILGDVAKVLHPAHGTFDLRGCGDIVTAIIGIITRHPMRQAELEEALSQWAPGEVEAALAALQKDGRAQLIERLGTRFWSATPAHYPDEAHSRAVIPGRRKKERANG
jgi:wyosine [tRNA(Phe)-imidazoG37] synthetase (radical SAM superfamily)